MNHPQRTRTNQRRQPSGKRPVPVDIWRKPGPLPDLEPITVPPEPGALLRSLGDPPMVHGTAAAHYFTSVIERAVAIAAALALSANLLADHEDD